jgi:hypothetical protein
MNRLAAWWQRIAIRYRKPAEKAFLGIIASGLAGVITYLSLAGESPSIKGAAVALITGILLALKNICTDHSAPPTS